MELFVILCRRVNGNYLFKIALIILIRLIITIMGMEKAYIQRNIADTLHESGISGGKKSIDTSQEARTFESMSQQDRFAHINREIADHFPGDLLAKKHDLFKTKEDISQDIKNTEQSLEIVRKKIGIPTPDEVPQSIQLSTEELKKTEINLSKIESQIHQESGQDNLHGEARREKPETNLYEKLKNRYSQSVELSSDLSPQDRYHILFGADEFSKEDEEMIDVWIKTGQEEKIMELADLREKYFLRGLSEKGSERSLGVHPTVEMRNYYQAIDVEDPLTKKARDIRYREMNG